MARHGKDSILLRSAESIGRVIGSLQRQLDSARVRFGDVADTDGDGPSRITRNDRSKSKPKATARAKAKAAKPGTNGPKATTPRTATEKRARKSR